MAVKGIETLEQALRQNNGKSAVISTSHKLYGNQKIKCKLDCIIDDERIGFRVKSGQEIYVYRNEIERINTDGLVFFADDVMCVSIQIE